MWTASETVRLCELVEEHTGKGGRKLWGKIVQGLPGRTENEAKCRWKRLPSLAKKKKVE